MSGSICYETLMNKRLQNVIDHPLHRHLGVTDIRSADGCGEIVMTITKNAANPAGMFHGGVIYLLCDVCAYGGLLSLLADDTEAVTHDIQVSVMQAARLGDTVTFRSEVVRMGARICFIDVRVSCDDAVIASARVTKSLLKNFKSAVDK